MTTDVTETSAALIERVVVDGDLGNLTPQQRVDYYRRVCDSLGLNPYTKPFAYLRLSNKLVLYAQRDATDQLRAKHGVSVSIVSREVTNGVYVVTAQATLPDGRTDTSIGAVPIDTLKGEALANAYMKGETKAKRRVTLSIVGLGWLDETETSSIPDAGLVEVDLSTGEIAGPKGADRVWADAVAALEAARTIEELRNAAAAVPKRVVQEHRDQMVALFNVLKDRLEAPVEEPVP